MSLSFIFMLTHNDKTIPDARARLDEALAAGVHNIGFKDVGLPFAEQKLLAADIRKAGAKVFLEVVSLDRESEMVSARAGMELEVDYLLGGTRVTDTASVISGTPIRYFPFPGEVVGHPSKLQGTIEEIAESAKEMCSHDSVHGIDLLAYRFAGDVPALMNAVCTAATKPVIIAGTIDRLSRIAEVMAAGATGFTVGTAALNGAFPARRSGLSGQLESILAASQGMPDADQGDELTIKKIVTTASNLDSIS
jgi:hypothetical protein